ncbi:MAG TPA: class I SAM-dependent methyltransferase [Acidimicrobiales bacterium]|nr:class I SAM-dependent methyltransferase [Acidimicrobiales bacterium]
MTLTTTPRYAFGDDDLAARRLDLVAEVFDPSSRRFVAAVAPAEPAVAIDLGCGPGHTTRLLSAVSGASRTIGLDTSERFLARARSGPTADGVEFRSHDVTRVPFPAAPAGLVYGRLLLAHLADPAQVASGWLTQLAPGGVLAVDELESIDPRDPVLADYEEVAVALVRARGGLMYAGPAVAPVLAAPPAGYRRVHDEVVTVDVPVPVAARMFSMNLAVWRNDAGLVARFGRFRLERLAAGLDRLARSTSSRTARWELRQMAVARTAP